MDGPRSNATTGLVLTGGGARAAYQVGVLKAIAEFLPKNAQSPFSVVCGTSAGAINAAALAVGAQNFRQGVLYLVNTWKNFHASQIYRTDVIGVFNNTVLWIAGLICSALGINKLRKVSLLNNTPLIELLEEMLPYEKIQDCIDSGILHALSITVSGYGSGESVTFYQGSEQIVPWQRKGRMGIATEIDVRHLLASSSLPFIFPAARINREYFGDGSMRQIAPLSPALHLGATSIMVIGVTATEASTTTVRTDISEYPSLAHIAGHVLNSIFLDSMEVDLERVKKINELVAVMPADVRESSNFKHVDVMVISPSQPIEKIAERHAADLPWTIRLLLSLIGARQRSGSTLVSYLLSEKKFCRALIDLGYQDALKRREEIMKFLDVQPSRDTGQPSGNDESP